MNRAIFKASIKATAAMFALLFALGMTGAFAADTTDSSNASGTDIKTKIISSVKHVENFYNAFGVCYMSTETSNTVTQTTSTSDANGESKTNSSTTTQQSFTMQTWKGGSLKVDYSTSTSTTTGTDGSSSVTNSKVTYVYDDAGRLESASGTATTTGTLASDAYGGSGGSYTSTQTTSYVIKNAQALPSQTVTDTTTTVEGQTKSTSHDVTTFEYELIGGTWHLMKEVSNSSTTSTDGGSEQRTTTKIYSRDANGVCTGISQTVTGTSTSVDDNGGTWTYNITNYSAEFQFDEVLGWYLAHESYDLELSSDASSSSSTGANNAESVSAENDRAVNSSSSDSNSDSAATAGANSKKNRIMPVYNEKLEKYMETRIKKLQQTEQERLDETYDDIEAYHNAYEQQQNEIDKQLQQLQRNSGGHPHHFMYH